jgi:NAD+ kinase
MSGINRTVVLASTESLRLSLTGGQPAMELDGVLGGRLREGDEIEVSYRPDAGRLVRIEGSRAAARSRVKLSLLDLPVLPQELVELLPREMRDRMTTPTDLVPPGV